MVELGFCEAEAGGPLRQALPQARGGRAGPGETGWVAARGRGWWRRMWGAGSRSCDPEKKDPHGETLRLPCGEPAVVWAPNSRGVKHLQSLH